jgi:hypothetical protein
VEAVGFLYMCNTRAGNAELWQHWFIEAVIKYIVKARDFHQRRSEDGELLRVVFSTDGELVILQEAFNEKVLAAFKEASIDYIKNGPSITSKHQPADVSDNFRDLKAGLRTITKKRVDVHNATLRRNLGHYFDGFKQKHPTAALTAAHQQKIVFGIEKIVHVLRSKSVTVEKMVEGFIRCGQHVRNAAPGQSTIDYDRMMARNLAPEITDEERNTMRAARPQVDAKFRAEGRVTDAFLDELGIVRSPGAVERDELNSVSRQHCMLVTHDDTVARYRTYVEKRDAPPTAAPDTALKKAQKLVQQDAKKKAKDLEKRIAADAEKVRRAGLTKEARAAEDAQAAVLKREKADEKKRKAQEKADKVEQAKALVTVEDLQHVVRIMEQNV